MPTTLAELILLLAAIYFVYRLLEPLRRRLERFLLLWIDPSRTDIIDAEIVTRERKKNKE
jgi:hypothetical protein